MTSLRSEPDPGGRGDAAETGPAGRVERVTGVANPEMIDLEAPDHARALSDGLPTPRRYWSVVSIWLTMSMAVLDASIANIALPTIAQELGASPVAAIWVVNAYQIAIAMGLLPVAAMGEIFGYRRVYRVGVVLFIIASLGCAMSTSLPFLAAARFFQGFGAAAIMGVNGALVRFTYPGDRLGRGIGYNALVVASMSAAGPSIAAAILAVGHWQWLFAVNVPLGVLSLVIGWRSLPEVEPSGERLDVVAALLNAVTFGAVFLGCAELARGSLAPGAFGTLAVGVAAAFLLVRRESREARPLVPIDLMRIPILRLSYATSACSFGASTMAMVSLPFYLQRSLGYDHVQTGLLITPMPLGIALAAPVAGRLVERYPAGLLGGIGLLVMAGGYVLLSFAPQGPHSLYIMGAMTICGMGFGTFQSPNNRTMLGVAPPERSGAAGGMLATARLFGQTSGAVVVALLFRLAGPASTLPLILAAIFAVIAAGLSIRRLAV